MTSLRTKPGSPLPGVESKLVSHNLMRAWWMILVTTIVSVGLIGVSWITGHPELSAPAIVVDLAGSVIFFVLLSLGLLQRLPEGPTRRLSAYSAVFFLLVCELWYFAAVPHFGDNAAYLTGVLVLAMFLVMPPAFFCVLLGANQLIFAALIVLIQPPYPERLSALATSSAAVLIACVANLLQFRAFRSQWLNEFKILEQNRGLEASNRAIQARSEELDELMAIAAHDLRAPLLSIASLCRMQKEESDWQDEKHREFLEAIEESCSKMAGRVSQIISAHREGESGALVGPSQTLDLREVVRKGDGANLSPGP